MKSRRRTGGAAKPREFPPETEPNIAFRASTLGPTGYAPLGLRLAALPPGSLLPHQTQPHGDANAFRAVLVVNVPRDALYPDASQWGAFDVSIATNAVIARSVSFVCATVASVARAAPVGQVRVFAEAMLREPMELPAHDDPTDVSEDYVRGHALAPGNVMGYRLWCVFGPGAIDPEIALRQQIFHAQDRMGLLPGRVVAIKQALCPLPDDETRQQILLSMASAKKRRKPSGGDAPGAKRAAGDGDEPMEDAPDEPVDAEAEAAMSEAELKQAALTRPSSADLALLLARRVRHAGNLWNGVASMDTYLRDVVGGAYAAARTLTVDALQDRFGVAPMLALPTAELLWLPDASRDGLAAAAQCWGFDQSVAAFFDETRETSACALQLLAASYGLPDGELRFPLRHAVWELAPQQLEPVDFFTELLPWSNDRFAAAVRQLSADAQGQAASDAAAASAAAVHPGGAVPDTLTLAMQSAFSSMARSRVSTVEEAEMTVFIRNTAARARQRVAPTSVPNPDSAREMAMRRTEAMFLELEVTRNYTLSPFMAKTDTNCAETEHLMSAIIPTYRRANALLDEGLAALAALRAPENTDEAAWRYEHECALFRLFATTTLQQLLGVIARNIDVPEVYRVALARLRAAGRLSDLYKPNWCRLPQLSVEANALVAQGAGLAMGINMMHGMIETMEFLSVTALQATDPELRNPTHSLSYGQKASGKSFNAECAAEALPAGNLQRRDWASEASSYTHSNDSNHVVFHDEASELLTVHTKDAQRRNAVKLARAKQQYSSGMCPFERYDKQDGEAKSRLLRVQAFRPTVTVAFTNEIVFGGDAALLDRFNVMAFAPFAMSQHVMAVERAQDGMADERAALWRAFCEDYKTEMTLKTMLVMLARARVIPSINTDVLKTMMTEALIDAVQYVPAFGESMRAAGRHEQYATALIFQTAFYTVMRSEASELVRWLGRGTQHAVEPAFLRDVATIFGPHLYARMDHGCWMLSQMIRADYPFIYYNVLRAIVSSRCHFRRAYLATAYRASGALLIDDQVAERLASRDAEGRVMPEFVNELLRVENMLDNYVFRTAPGHKDAMPIFLETGNDAVRVIDPNWMAIDGTLGEVVRAMLPTVNLYYKMDEAQLATLLMHASTRRVRMPVFAHVSSRSIVSPAHLAFQRANTNVSNNPITYVTNPIVRIINSTQNPQVLISTGAMMIPPQLLLVLLLTAAENTHTVPVQTVLPFEFASNAQLTHTWRVARRPDVEPVFVNRTAVTHSFVQMERRANAATAAKVAALAVTTRSAGTDMVRTAFYRHMRALHQMPPYASVVAELCRLAQAAIDAATTPVERVAASSRLISLRTYDTPTPTREQHDEIFRTWADGSPAAPGAPAERCAFAYRASEALAASVANPLAVIHYPFTNSQDHHAQSFILTVGRAPLPPIPRRNRHAGIAGLSLAPEGSAYADNRRFIRALMARLCSDWHEHLAVHAASVEWRHLCDVLISIMWGRPAAEAYARTRVVPGRREFRPEETARCDDPVFSIAYLRLLADWLHFVHLTRRMGLAMRRNPALATLQQALDSLLDLQLAPIELEDALQVDEIRRCPPHVDIAPVQQLFYEGYKAAMDRLRPLRAAWLAHLMKTADDCIFAERNARSISQLQRGTNVAHGLVASAVAAARV